MMDQSTGEPIGERLARIETKIDNFFVRVEDHERRIRLLEIPPPKWHLITSAVVGVISVMVALIAIVPREFF